MKSAHYEKPIIVENISFHQINTMNEDHLCEQRAGDCTVTTPRSEVKTYGCVRADPFKGQPILLTPGLRISRNEQRVINLLHVLVLGGIEDNKQLERAGKGSL